MKTIKYLFSLCLMALTVWTCADDEKNVDLNSATAPTELDIQFEITQDNSGLVTMTPLGEGAISFDIAFGDDTPDPVSIEIGDNVSHTYSEGTYTVLMTGYGVTGLTSEITKELVVSFQAPTNLEVTIENDAAVSKQVNVTVNADFAVNYEVFSGETGVVDPVVANIGDTAVLQYSDAGFYDITIVVMGGAIETTTYVEENFEVTSIEAPIVSAPTPPSREPVDVISIFSSAYEDVEGTDYFPDWGQGGQGSSWAMFDLGGDEILQYVNLSYQGINLAEGTTVDVTAMEYLHLDVWTTDAVTDIETSIINNAGGVVTEAPVTESLNAGEWTSIEIPISAYTDQGLTVSEIFQMKFVGTPWAAGTVFIDNIYFYKSPSGPSPIIGSWQVTSLGVGPTQGATNWWSNDVSSGERGCYYDDSYVFNADGSFVNVQGGETWLETWQEGVDAEGCGAPVAPHNGTNPATYSYDEATGILTIVGQGAYVGLPKAHNGGEDGFPVDDTITYMVEFVDDNTIVMDIEAGSGVWWRYNLVKNAVPVSPIAGSWQVTSLGVGPTQGATNWWSNDVSSGERGCYYDDSYVFNADGSFANIQGAETWLETWQEGVDAEGCGAPVAPHNGTNPATYSYDEATGILTIVGQGAYVGLPKAHNGGEDGFPVDDTITYMVEFVDDNTIVMDIEAGSGVWWRYNLVKN